ncbi:hypothetical protein C8F04DRAFT_1192098 [Mycena alexandri]|uniref:Uncharacterized protein n=1 Tax=Mycena alexandri TaxID=1745969 RepID=A0AAD6WXG9_9AGAR|nr:hypothetical protein C8F04DRAFT_1192098 [Mycena alexandri]
MSKKRVPRRKPPNPSGAYRPGYRVPPKLSGSRTDPVQANTRGKAGKTQKGCVGVLSTKRRRDTREKSSESTAATVRARLVFTRRPTKVVPGGHCRAAAKARKRQWDPPKKPKTTEQTRNEEDLPRSPSFHSNLVADELLNGPLHFQDYRAGPSSENDSDFRRMDLRRRIRTETSEVNAAPQSMHTTSEERVAIEVLATMGGRVVGGSGGSHEAILRRANLLSSDDESGVDQAPPRHGSIVDQALKQVVELNAAPLTAPTEREANRWVRTTFGFWGHYLQDRVYRDIDQWRHEVEP